MSTVPKFHCQRERGQAIPIGIAALLGITLLILILFNTGQVVSEKMRLENAADAAAYSGLIWQARTLNYIAYTNRAMVANEVAIAQLVTMVSWSRYLNQLGQNLFNALFWVPYVGAAMKVLSQVTLTFQNVIQTLARVSIPVIDKVIGALSISQSVAYRASYVAAPLTAREVVLANDPNYQVTLIVGNGYLASNSAQWNSVGEEFSSNQRLQRQADVIVASRDGFTTTRRGTVFANNGWLRVPSLPPVSFFFNTYLHRQADTRLISQGDVSASTDPSDLQWEWKAKDTMSLWVTLHYYSCWRTGLFSFDCGWKDSWDEVPVPIAYGSAFTSTTSSDIDFGNRWFTGDRPNSFMEGMADWNVVNIHPATPGYNGVRKYWDIQNADQGLNTNVTTDLGIEVRRNPASPVRTSSNIPGMGSANPYVTGNTRNGFGPGMFRADDNFANTLGGQPEVSAVSHAQIFYQRPRKFNDRPDGRTEYSNLFNPYWDVHLTNPRTERRNGWLARKTAPILP